MKVQNLVNEPLQIQTEEDQDFWFTYWTAKC